ncbi:hypothetical protein SAMN04515667_2035 [Formosa sp. Hel1_31_208]|uniref:hypothetical protein n=1 Tax=Formosa sp. Hel1_31_208 TaxID=1798225 RepID=UPI00087A6B57|nr:hypothetical protein [Formosa sp. Hel1_31_208]SDS37592.1 hypothetical protein SAMN04515667_2035 [Formosa sp. Hel1_31_208]
MKVKKEYWILLIIPITYILIYNLRADYIGAFVEEDGFVESIGALAFLMSSVVFTYLFFLKESDSQYKFFGKSTKWNIYFGLLGILFFMAFGEEISWGQRIFGWNTPERFSDINAQKETNLHNLWWFQAYKKDGTSKSFFENMLNFNRLFNIFWFLFCVITPITSLISKKFKSVILYLGIPIVPLWIGGFFLLNYIVFISGVNIGRGSDYGTGINYSNGFDEIKESFYAVGFAILSLFFLKTHARRKFMQNA